MKNDLAKQIADEVCRIYGPIPELESPPDAKPLTRAQREVIDVIIEYRWKEGISPTLDEIGSELGVKKTTISEHVGELVRKGWIRRERNARRSIMPIDGAIRRGTARLRELVAMYAAQSGAS